MCIGQKILFFIEKAKNLPPFFVYFRKNVYLCALLRAIAHDTNGNIMKLLIVIVLLAAAFILLSVRVILKRNGRFSSQHISQSKTMRERGIHCATSQDREARRKAPTRLDPKQL